MIYGTQEMNCASVEPGMLVRHDGKTYRASANTDGNLYLFRLYEQKRVSDCVVDVYLNHRGEPQIQ